MQKKKKNVKLLLHVYQNLIITSLTYLWVILLAQVEMHRAQKKNGSPVFLKLRSWKKWWVCMLTLFRD